MKLVACVPWTGGDQWRRMSFTATTVQLAEHVQVFVGSDTSGQRRFGGPVTSRPPNRAAARNAAIRQALRDADPTHVLLVDADTEAPWAQVAAAVDRSIETGGIVYPFDDFRKVRRDRTRSILWGAQRPANWQQLAYNESSRLDLPAGGALVVPVEVFDVVGLFDERFTSWGCEDRCFLIAAETLTVPSVRIPGPAFHWWHPPAQDKDRMRTTAWRALRGIADEYREAAGYPDFGWPLAGWPRSGPEASPTSPPDREAMRSVLSSPGGPRATM